MMKFNLIVVSILMMTLIGTVPSAAQDNGSRPPISPANAAQLEQVAFWESSVLRGIDWSPTGQTLAVLMGDGVQLYDASQPDASPRMLSKFVFTDSAIAFSPDGSRLAVGAISFSRNEAHQVIVLDTQGKVLLEMAGHQGAVLAVAFSPDGSRLASASQDGTVRLWDAVTGENLAILEGHTNQVYDVAFSPDGTLLVSAGLDGTIRLWNGLDGSAIGEPIAAGWDQSVAFSPDGSLLAYGTNGTIILWDVASRQAHAVLVGSEGQIFKLAFNPAGTLLASTGLSSVVQVWDTTTYTEVARWDSEQPYPNDLGFSPDGTLLAVASSEGIELWGAPPDSAAAEQAPVASTPTANTIQSSNAAQVEQLSWFSAYSTTDMAWSLDGTQLVIAQMGGRLLFFDAASQKTEEYYIENTSSLYSMASSPDGVTLALGDMEGRVILFNTLTHLGYETQERHPKTVTALAFSPDGTRLASADYDGFINLWDAATGSLISADMEHEKAVNRMVFSADGQWLISASNDGTVRLWEMAAFTQQKVASYDSPIKSLAISGNRMAFGTLDGRLYLWDLATWTEQSVLEGHSAAVTTLAFSPDGSLLASGSEDTSIRLWDAATGTLLATLQKHNGTVLRLAFSPDGTTLASAGWDDAVRLWGVPASAQVSAAGNSAADTQIITAANASLLEPQIKLDHYYISIHWTPDSRALAGIELAGTAQRIQLPDQAIQQWQVPIYALHTVLLSPDSATLAVAAENEVRLWDVASDTNRLTLQSHTGQVNAIAFSPDGSLLASASNDKTIRVWNVATGENVLTLEGHTLAVEDVVFSPDGTKLASIARNDAVRLWDAATGAALAVLKTAYPAGGRVVFSPDGTTLIAPTGSNTIQLWDVNTGSLKAELSGVQISSDCLDISPNGELIAASGEGKLLLWDTVTGALLAEMETGSIGISNVEFSPDGSRLLTRDMNHTIQLWGVPGNAAPAALTGPTPVPMPTFTPLPPTPISAVGTCTVVLIDIFPLFTAPSFGTSTPNLAEGTIILNGKTAGSDGQTWYRLDNGNWLPEEMLRINNIPPECAALPQVSP